MYKVNKIRNTLYENKISKEYAIKLGKIKENEKISILSDVMFKTMFQTKGREKYPSKFISYYTDYSFENLKNNLIFDKNELDKEFVNKKSLRCDYVSSIDRIKLNIEINNNSSLEIMERNMEYAFRLYSSNTLKGSNYDYTKVIQFNINNFSFKKNDKIVDIFTISNDEGIKLTDKIVFIQIYVPNLRKKWYTVGIENLSEDEKFLLTLVETNTESLLKFGKDNDIMEEYINDALKVSKSEQLLEAYDKEWALKDEGKREGFHEGFEDGFQDGFQDGFAEGLVKGVQEKQMEFICNMLTKGMGLSLISEITGLEEQEIINIKNNMDM